MTTHWIPGGVTAAHGYTAAGTWSGIKRNRRPDLALVVSRVPAVAVGLLTTNRIQAAPVRICRAQLRRGMAQAMLANSGCANCLTGAQGTRDARQLMRQVAGQLGIDAVSILPASTGVIGEYLPVTRMQRAIPRLVKRLSARSHREAAWAILTTDTHPKEAAVECPVGRARVRIGGMAKGAGMIEPHLATMLALFTSDVAMSRPLLQRALQQACAASFNCITVDGDMSTNDTALLLANGLAGHARITRPGPAYRRFADGLCHVALELAQRLVEDGEGATRMAHIQVLQAWSSREADRCARHIANSPLVKTMLAGRDPNVGRIASAVGAAGVQVSLSRLRVSLNGCAVIVGDRHRPAQRALRHALAGRGPVRITVQLGAGSATAQVWTCDLTSEYVRINTQYPR